MLYLNRTPGPPQQTLFTWLPGHPTLLIFLLLIWNGRFLLICSKCPNATVFSPWVSDYFPLSALTHMVTVSSVNALQCLLDTNGSLMYISSLPLPWAPGADFQLFTQYILWDTLQSFTLLLFYTFSQISPPQFHLPYLSNLNFQPCLTSVFLLPFPCFYLFILLPESLTLSGILCIFFF